MRKIPIDPAILAAIGHRFIAKNNKTKNAVARVRGDSRGDEETGDIIILFCLRLTLKYRTSEHW